MSLRLGRAGVSLGFKISRNFSKFNPVLSSCISPKTTVCVEGRRYLFSSDTLGLENYKRQKQATMDRLGTVKDKFFSRMEGYMKTSETNTIFTEDMKSMVYIAETDEDLDIGVQMIRRFQTQNNDLHFSNFSFGPLVMRLLYLQNKPDRAYELLMDKSLSGFFDQKSSFVVLMDMLYENKQYDKVLAVMDVVMDRQIGGHKYPMDPLTLTSAACFQMNTPESLEKIMAMIKESGGRSDIISLRCAIYAAMLAVTQKKPDVALEMLSLVQLRGSGPTPIAYVNVKALTFAALGRVEEAVHILRSVVEQDLPDHIKFRGGVFEEVIEAVRDVATEYASKDVQHQLTTTIKALQDGGLVMQQNMAEYLTSSIVRNRRMSAGYKQRDRPSVAGVQRQPKPRLYKRPGLLE